MPKILEILQLGNPLLLQKSQPVTNFSDPDVQELIDDLLHTLEGSGGVGISAPQVGRLLRIFIIGSKPTPAYPTAEVVAPIVMINPHFWSASDSELGWEGCLSIPGLRGQVQRQKQVHVGYDDRFAIARTVNLEGFMARIFQHEHDHLEGILFPKHVDFRLLATDAEYQKTMAP